MLPPLPSVTRSEPYVTSLLKMYVRQPYSCHELFGFDIMLDENLKPWVLEVNISPRSVVCSEHTHVREYISILSQCLFLPLSLSSSSPDLGDGGR